MSPILRCALVLLPLALSARAAPPFPDTMRRAADSYRSRAEQAAAELNRTRGRIADEEAPLLAQIRAAEDRIVAAESETARIEAQAGNSGAARRRLLQDLQASRNTASYLATLAHDGLGAAREGLAPGEDQQVGARLQDLAAGLDAAAAGPTGGAALDAAEFLLARTEYALGGYRAEGSAVLAESNQVVAGTFAYAGPETYFLPANGAGPGSARPQPGAKYPISFRIPSWDAAAAKAFFSGQPGLIPADASGGKALRLAEIRGGLWQHVQKGGAVAYVIVLVGLVAAAMALQKLRDLRQMEPAEPATVEKFVARIAAGRLAEAERSLAELRPTTRELFAVGLRHCHEPRPVLEERLQAVLLEQRLHQERRLPLLAVIATAAPLMGLLGTVVGMVKTFALITVYGTGNAGKLSAGISEVLVATELGLTVAIPTLVVHGFLAQRVHRNLSLLERQALQLATAIQLARVAEPAAGDEPIRA